jgi:CBS domain containing-hemolysin-like protein
MGIWAVIGLLTIPLFVAINGFFVAAEFALVAVRRTRVEEMVQQGHAGAKAVEAGVTNLDRSIAATQLGITLASIALGWIGEPAVATLLEPVIAVVPEAWRGATAHSIAFGFGFLLITFLHVVFGELIPKTVALQIPDRAALWVATPLVLFARIARPLIFLMNGTGNTVLRLIGFQPASGREMVHSVEELALLIEDTEEAGILSETQADVVQKVFRLSAKRVRDCMVPRERMAALEVATPTDKVLEVTHTGVHTRMPIYEGTLDNVVGIVNTRDLVYLFSLRGIVVLEDTMYPPLFLDADDDVAAGLECFRANHRHMAVVRDADGKVLGLITLEDILEEIIGEIEDQHDRQAAEARFHGRRAEHKLPKPAAGPEIKPPGTG